MTKVIIFFVVFFLGLSQIAIAHPPSEIIFEPVEKGIKITVSHEVDDVESHFISKVYVKLNDEIVAEASFDRQDNNLTQIANCEFPEPQLGEYITIQAECNIKGELTERFQIE